MYFFNYKRAAWFYLLPGLFFIAFVIQVKAQVAVKISGFVFSEGKVPVANASVYLKTSKDSNLIAFSITKQTGAFNIQAILKDTNAVFLTVSHVSFKTQVQYFSINQVASSAEPVNFYLYPSSSELKEITINRANQKVIVKKDTVEFSVSAHLTPEVSKVEDLLKNMSGFNIDDKGRITFNGKEVEKIFIEGDDLTGGNYQLLSRNLNASLISKVQVIHNFNDNRLIGDFENSGTVAINLKVNEEVKNKISGSITTGVAPERRGIAESSMVLIKQKVKSLVIANYNNIALSPMADIQYYFRKDDVSNGNSVVPSDDAAVVYATKIPAPVIEDRYIKNNNDFGTGIMQSFRMGKAVKVKFLAGYSSAKLENKSENKLNTVAVNNTWDIQTDERALMKETHFFLQGGLKHDNLKKNTGSYEFFAKNRKINSQYSNISTIAVQDTLKEFLNNKGVIFHLTGNEVFLLRKKRLLSFDCSFMNDYITQEFDVATKRYADFFKLDPSFCHNNQVTVADSYKGDLKLRLTGRISKKTGYNYGIYSQVRQFNVNNSILNKSNAFNDSVVYQPASTSSYTSLLYLLFGQINSRLSAKSLLSTAFNGGYALQKSTNVHTAKSSGTYPFKLSIDYRYNISSVKVLSAAVKTGQALPDERFFFSGPVLNGGITVQNGAKDLLLTRFSEISLSFFHMNIYKNSQFFINSFLVRSDRSYKQSFTASPDYNSVFILPLNNNLQSFLAIGSEKYVPILKSKFSLQAQVMQQAGDIIINNFESKTKFSSFNSSIKYLSAFGGKVNFEMAFSNTYLINNVTTARAISNKSKFWQHNASGKLKMSLSKKLYSNLFYVRYSLSPGNRFNIFDYFLNYKAASKATFSLTVHNILNTGNSFQRTINTITTFENSFAVVRRYFLFKVAFNF